MTGGATSPIDPSSTGRPASETRFFVERLTLTNFRNYASARLNLDARPVVLVGENGAGKTSVLEAVSLLGPGQGLRSRPYKELARKGGPGGWAIAATISANGEPIDIGTGFGLTPGEESTGRSVRIAGKDTSTASLADYVKPVWLIPAMDGLFTGPASERRRFLDRATLTIDPAMRVPRARFERAMRQRNRLFQMHETSPALFAGLEEQMAEAGTAIAAARLDALARLTALIETSKADLIRDRFPWASLELAGTLEAALSEHSAVEVEDFYRARLSEMRERDRAAFRALEGPHLSDLVVFHGPSNREAELCSSGEQKALLLGLILAQAELIKTQDGAAPLILLDEVAAHLDAARREALFAELLRLGSQAWMTGTDEALFAPILEQAQLVQIADGTLQN
ncbi:DNA replication/repair protein RecF [Methyloligella sp. 2.7D]|uniref:DNA replication/repair protein RecF n=1 Tax=unclassified Methyloligella TaxID=2625955 RepID=UPI00157C268D|nr:DNA replication/repair protein RecF [Methyloligella sp. GL2]QKP75978.1 DNA replication/repair protein RecF [Methyloligella sp. GL2]